MPFSVDADAGWTPLYLSTIAGMSTCLGALIGEWSVLFILCWRLVLILSQLSLRPLLVFCHPVDEDDEETAALVGGNSPSRLRKRFTGKRKVSPSTVSLFLCISYVPYFTFLCCIVNCIVLYRTSLSIIYFH